MENKKIEVGFILEGIKIEQFAVIQEHHKDTLESELATELQFMIDHLNKKVGVFLHFQFKQNNNVFIKLIISCHFGIDDKAWATFNDTENNRVIIPKGFLAHLAMITTGTSRGILFAKTEGTIFSKYMIPTLNVQEMIPEDGIFEITQTT